ncbi:ATP-binding cassette domain-containing protein [Prevotella sp.]|uniref:ATP-binding cassette domain-containing protein n=1 Tax=Prevotella sp. TaxID=59823 RepID=UPI00307CBFC0
MNIELYKAGMKYKDSQIFSDLSFLAGAGDRLALVSSDYKSLTMTLQAMLGMRRLCSGWASIDGEPVLPSVAACYRRYISYLPNNIDFEDIIVEQLAKSILTGDSKYSSKEAERHLQLLGVETDCLHRAFASLDASTAQRAALAVTVMDGRPIALLDNPTSQQDEAGSRLVADYLASSLFDDVAVVIATSDPIVTAVCNKKQNI